MLKSSKHAREDLRGRPAPEALSQVLARVNKKLKWERAIADIRALYEQEATVNPNQSSKHSQQKADSELMDKNNRYHPLTDTSWFYCWHLIIQHFSIGQSAKPLITNRNAALQSRHGCWQYPTISLPRELLNLFPAAHQLLPSSLTMSKLSVTEHQTQLR